MKHCENHRFYQWPLCGLCVAFVWPLCGPCVAFVGPQRCVHMSPWFCGVDVRSTAPFLHHTHTLHKVGSEKKTKQCLHKHILLLGSILHHLVRVPPLDPGFNIGEGASGKKKSSPHDLPSNIKSGGVQGGRNVFWWCRINPINR